MNADEVVEHSNRLERLGFSRIVVDQDATPRPTLNATFFGKSVRSVSWEDLGADVTWWVVEIEDAGEWRVIERRAEGVPGYRHAALFLALEHYAMLD